MILASLVALFVFIGAHVPKAFTLFYLALAIGTFWTYRQAPSMGLRRSQLIPPIWVLICLQVFSLGHAYGMVHYGYWGYAYRDFADLLSSVFLPIWCPRFQERCHPSRQYTRGLEDMTNASLQRGRQG
jgi:hypothetical protein